ncbi:MAG: sn-glycerol-3-phosphate ABC transporter ATP-binding protein UgpC [Phycisphaerae bacterium]|nr:sn-glycerol-3-phosphate ABC transporter ATP-binding protein UgpC [Phycisphaerae bacterium]
MAPITLHDVTKVYPGGHRAVRGVSLDIADGELVALVGPSGCGKSTTLRMIAGLEDVTSGVISIGGRVVNQVEPKDRDIAMVFQNYALYPHMTAYQNMAFSLRLRGVPRAEIDRRVRQAARMLDLVPLLGRRPREMSGGQRQRVAVGRAIVREPQCHLFDEPLSNLDARLRVTTRGELKALHQRLKTTTVYVTHDQEEAMTLGDRVVVMAQGIIQQAGPPLEVYRRPANRFVASFIGMPPMNFMDGTLGRDADSESGREVFVASEGGWTLSLPPVSGDSRRGSAGAPVVLGLRPQAFSIARDGGIPAGAEVWEVRVLVVEPLGESMDVTCERPGGERLVARIPAQEGEGVTPNSLARLAVDARQAHLFEPGEFGRSLSDGL